MAAGQTGPPPVAEPMETLTEDTALNWLQQLCCHADQGPDLYTISHQLVSVVLKWFRQVNPTSISCMGFEVLHQFLSGNVSSWEVIVDVAITYGIPMACSLLENPDMKEGITSIIMENRRLLIDMMKMLKQSCVFIAQTLVQVLAHEANDTRGSQTFRTAAKAGLKFVVIGGTRYVVSQGVKSIAKQAPKSATKQAAKTFTKQATKHAAKQVTRTAAKSIAKQGAKAATKEVAKAAVKQGAKQGVKFAAKQGAKSAAKHGAKSVAKHAAKSAAKSAAKQGAKSAAKSAAKQGAKSAAKHAAKSAAKQGAKSAAKQAAKSGVKHGAKSAAKSAAKSSAKHVAKSASKAGTKQAIKSGAKTATAAVGSLATPVGVIADATQLGLEAFGYKKTGKAIGATGNVASGAMTGFVLGGPIGAAVGGVAGGALWAGGEAIGSLIDYFCTGEDKEVLEEDKEEEGAVDDEGGNGETAGASGIWDRGYGRRDQTSEARDDKDKENNGNEEKKNK